MDKLSLGIAEKNKNSCISLLEASQTVPECTLFCDNIFERNSRDIQDRMKPELDIMSAGW